ncbi:HlyD family secretion protein [Pelosinus sp. UFO1]|uniref:HlyD family secretion protein n=1 Tax=Pelosinus sp. UFO1 TaxID=484770 RepID=UPI0004D0FB2C|nr:HlyD family secretion protein [Pelosinus sp. UFO1]AIF54079.1 secretion protein HlyD family protein [Pelosinus sp. UFO1]
MTEKPKISKNKIVLVVVIIIAILAAGGIWWWIRASKIVSTDDARVKGTIASISTKVPGRIETIAVKEGDNVQAGQILAKMESAEIEVQVAQAKANLTAAQAKLAGIKAGSRPQQVAQAGAAAAQAEANLENAKNNSERSLLLFNQGALSAQQRDAAQTALAVAKAQYDGTIQGYDLAAEGSRAEDIQVAEAQVEQAAAALKNAQLQLDNTTIRASVSGVIAVKSIDPGEIVSVGQPLFNITDLNDVWVAANIEETYIGKVQVGENVEVAIDAYPGKKFKGEVMEVGSAAGSQFALLSGENTSGNFTKVTQRLPIKIKALDAGEYVLKPGMSASIAISVN